MSKRITISQKQNEANIVGKISSVTVHNFMTFTAVTFHPGEHLNILIGPNGTGKSSMVAAIVIGMGGNCKLLSARLQLKDYIKHGKETATIEVCLIKDGDRNISHFKRSFGRRGKGSYQIDNRDMNETEYLHYVHAANIQVSNLCQFLPQDRVQDFAKQNPQELLLSTQQSVCEPEMVTMFAQLKKLQSDQNLGIQSVHTQKRQLQEIEERLKILKTCVEGVQKKNDLVQKREMCLKKKAWILYEQQYEQCRKMADDLKLAQQAFSQHEDEFKKVDADTKDIITAKKTYENTLEVEKNNLNSIRLKYRQLEENLENAEFALTRAQDDFNDKKASASEQARELHDLQKVIKAYENDCNEHNRKYAGNDLHEQERTFDRKISEHRELLRDVNENRENLMTYMESSIKPEYVSTENRLKTLENSDAMKLNSLKNRLGDTYQAILWLRENKHLFQYKVYEPMLLELNLKRMEYAKYVENSVAERDLIAFVCEDIEDMNLLIIKLRSEMKLQCNIIHSESATSILPKFASTIPIKELKQFGASTYLIDCLDGPYPILNYLCRVYNLQNVVVGSSKLDTEIDNLPGAINLVFAGSQRISVTTSRYTHQKTSMNTTISSKNLLSIKVDKEEVNRLKERKEQLVQKVEQFRSKRSKLEEKINEIEESIRQLLSQKQEISKQMNYVRECQLKIRCQKAKIEAIQKNLIDVDVEARKFQDTSKKLLSRILKQFQEYSKTFSIMLASKSCHDKARLRSVVYGKSCADIDLRLNECKENIERSKRYVDRISEILNTTKAECKAKQREAMALTNNAKPLDGKKFPFKAAFDALPNSINELLCEIDDIEDQISLMGNEDNECLREYENCLSEIDRLKETIKSSSDGASGLDKEIIRIHNTWYPKMLEIIETINENFGNFMISMNCAGEVELTRRDERDYDHYGIEIRVKYRANESLQALDRFVQSGGERAVAIAVYSLSLQQLTQVPFRCVDEINQGMDSKNERMIFNMLVQHVARQNQSQFFYVTPKLLHGMSYNNYVTCSVVYNGAEIDDEAIFTS